MVRAENFAISTSASQAQRSTFELRPDYANLPAEGVEPSWLFRPLDFESSAYANFATPATATEAATLVHGLPDAALYRHQRLANPH